MRIHAAAALFVVLCWTPWAIAYKTIIDVLSEDPRFETLIIHLQRTRLVPAMNRLEAGTLFAPDNDAFDAYHGPPITRDVLLYHLLHVDKRHKELEDGLLLESALIRPNFLENNTGQRLKVAQKFGQRIYINEARITTRDIPVNNNTVIHTISRVLTPPSMIVHTVARVNDELYSLMEKSNLSTTLEQEQPFTVFVSRSHLLHKFSPVESDYLTSTYGLDDLRLVVDYLALYGTVYESDFPVDSEKEYTTLSSVPLTLAHHHNKRPTVNGIPIIQTDIIAANGIVHILDDLPISPSLVFDTRKYLYGLGATRFIALLEKYGLDTYLEPGASNHTFLALGNDAIDEGAIPDNIKKEWLAYHITIGVWPRDRLYNRMLLDTRYNSSYLNGAPQRLQVHVESQKTARVIFGQARTVGDPVDVKGDNIIYQLSEPLELPLDIFSTLVVDLNLSTYIATLYVSGVVDEMKRSMSGITLFVPTNKAFQDLGLVAKYLTHPSGLPDLRSVLRFHTANTLLYRENLLQDAYEVTTLANTSLRVGGRDDTGNILIGWPQQNTIGVLCDMDRLVVNGVVHTTDRVQIPDTVQITHAKLLNAMEANVMLDLLKRTSLLDNDEHHGDYVILAPTDRAFARINIDELLNNPTELERVVKLHILPRLQPHSHWPPFGDSQEYGTLLSDRDKVIVRDLGRDEWMVQVKGDPNSAHAHVLATGNVTDGHGRVFELDAVLMPVRRGIFGLPWVWSIVLMVTFYGALLSAIVYGGFRAYRVLQRRWYQYASPEEDAQPDETTPLVS